MIRVIPVLLLCVFFNFSCKDDDEPVHALLAQPPFHELTDSIRLDPGNSLLYFRRGTLLFENNQIALAEQDLRKAWEMDPLEIYALRLTNILMEKNPADAIAFLEEARRKLPESLTLRIALARGYQQQGDLNRADEIADNVLSEHPGQLDALTLKSELLSSQDQDEASIAFLERAYRLVPSDPEIALQLAFAYAEAKDSRAIALADSLIREDRTGRMEHPYFIRGVYYSNIGTYPSAIRDFDEAIRRNFKFMPAYINKAIVYYDQKQYDRAMDVLLLALNVEPTNAEIYYWMGKTHEARGEKADAKLNYQKAYGLDREHQLARDAAARL